MRHIGKGFLVIALILFGGSGILEAKPIVKIGVIAPMSGDVGNVCREDVIIIKKRVEEMNARPETKYNYQLIFEDSRWEPKTSHLAAMKLISQDKVDALMPFGSLSARVTLPLAIRSKVPQVALASSEGCSDGKWGFGYYPTSDDMSGLLLETMKALGYKKYAVVGKRQEATERAAECMAACAKKLGIENAGVFYSNPGDVRDYRMYLLRARETKPDIYIFEADPPDIDIIFRQAKQLGGFENVAGEETFSHVEDKQFLDGIWVAGDAPWPKVILERLKTWGIEPHQAWTVYTYDFPKILIEAFERAGDGKTKPEGDAVCAELKRMKTAETIFGAVPQDEHGAFRPKPVLVYYEKGQAREVSLEELKKLKGVGK